MKKKLKDTELGLIPEDWMIKKLGDLAFITKLAGFEYSLYFNNYKDEGEIIVIRGTNISRNKLDLSDIKTIPKSVSSKLPRSKLFKNDLIFAYVGTIGPIWIINENDKYHLGPNTSKITCNNQTSFRFVYHCFCSINIKTEIVNNTSIGAQPSLSMSKIRSFRLITPPTLAEQEAIADVLSDTDALITSLETTIQKKKLLKQGAMQELLTGKRRLPGFGGKGGMKDTEVGRIPEDWEVKKLGDMIEFQGGSQPDKSNFIYDEKPGFIRLLQIRDYKGDSFTTYIPSKLARRFCDKNDIMIGRYGPPIFQILRGLTGAYNVALIKAIPKNNVSKSYIYYFLKTSKLFDYVETLSRRTSGQTGIDLNDLKNYAFSLPPILAEQEAIAQLLSEMDEGIEALEKKLEKTKGIKQGLMQVLLTGKIRLV
ncbi:restriction endonuclease subunit S [Leptospira sp. 2 VSF19]|uniref:Restriction endonuclease subunit S n=1 Tax=Leptospira soteropolitanensis TaxID=2950025 RepID=A0AAW5VBQ3_9LEPT|nr:restriction endonuclease subunit S [Leptospira soteropolitanensis]MCW7491990.1 restriction endonuclease subunit S [Leptospira soteropolitanensis]MCW7499573.1 restriction endonuclease subunit S [Leptospira soteropolitanensis]MCW7521824.1 restriction endonuclease subunit S [Leptospira soteropolitanensis]MCW7525677.1 restriction endonuclease subunit S [Leptospira soteropolitanensis]MCW7530208.1 restriction endonuclease subunit S [Leptospira soteropolitanensis]